MSAIYAIIGYPLGFIMKFCYDIVNNYGVALIMFTIISKVILIPTSIKQQKSMAKMAAFRPQMEEIQKKYKNNPTKMQEELNLLYAREKYSPFSGCLPLLIQFPILFGLIDVVYYPLKHIIRFAPDLITEATTIATRVLGDGGMNRYSNEISIINAVNINPDAFVNLGGDFLTQVQNFDFTFMGINLGDVPTISFSILVIIPILSLITSGLLSWVSMKMSSAGAGSDAAMQGMNKSMMFMMPLLSASISLAVPAGVGLYWIFTNVFSTIQTMILFKIYNPAEMAAKAKAEAEERRAKEREEKIETKKQIREGHTEVADKALSGKEVNKMKLAAARKRMAEKYGEDYAGSDDE